MTEHRHSTSLPPSVHRAELDTIKARRAAAGLDATAIEVTAGSEVDQERADSGAPTTQRGLIGLAISGGGIRSSTFSLGVIQALARRGIFKAFDYVSTVSGGGYTGSMLSSVLRDAPDPDAPFPLDKAPGVEESAALQHLRNGSNYLNPGGLFNTLRLPAVVVRGLAMNALLIIPVLMLAVYLTEWIHEHRFGAVRRLGDVMTGVSDFMLSHPWLTPVLGAVALGLFYFLLRRADRGNWARRNQQERLFAALLFIAGVILIAVPILHATSAAIALPYSALREYVSENMRGQVWLIAGGIFLGAYALVKATEKLQATKKIHVLLSKTFLYGAAIAGPAFIFGLYLLLLVAQVDSPFLSGDYPELAPRAAVDAATGTPAPDTVRLVLSDSLLAEFDSKGIVYGPTAGSQPDSIAVPAQYCPATQAWLLARSSTGDFPSSSLCTASNDTIEASSQIYRLTPTTASLPNEIRHYSYEVWGANLHLGGPPSEHTLMRDSVFLWMAAFLLVFNVLFLDVNMSSLHRFYRDRLSRLYIFRVAGRDNAQPNDAQKMSALNGTGSVAPYHIINTTLNLQGNVVESTRGRSSDFFMFSKHYCGGPHTGYCDTKALEHIDPHLSLGTAMAISAAAAAPNMGSATNRSLVFVMTLLNFRLGYWLPNPLYVNKRSRRIPRWTMRPGTNRLLDEALGALTAGKSMVNLSDGGHLENLAAWELLRRRCRLIVIIDGEADPDLTFNGLVTLMRIVKIDLGVTIRMEGLDELRWNAENVTGSHFTLGEIDYGADGKGVLVYVKSSVTGDENPYVEKYRADNPTFPHETTADQFFDEVQFEAYRALGHHVGSNVANAIGSDLGSFIENTIARYEEEDSTT